MKSLTAILILIPLAIISACVQPPSDNTGRNTNLSGFCGGSTGSCASDSGCKIGGCSGQICEGINEGTITTCEYRECYNADAYNVKCGCVSGKCRWYK